MDHSYLKTYDIVNLVQRFFPALMPSVHKMHQIDKEMSQTYPNEFGSNRRLKLPCLFSNGSPGFKLT